MNYMSIATGLMIAMSLTTSVAAERPVTQGAKVGEWTMDIEAAKALAKAKNLPLLLNFTGSDWCGWCKLMDKNVFSTEAWKNYATQNVVTVFIDFPQDKSLVPANLVDRNKTLSEQLKVEGYPTYILLAPDGEKQLGKLSASRDATPTNFIQSIKKLVEWPAKIAKLSPESKAIYDKAKAGMVAVEEELQAWAKTKPERNEANNKRLEGFMERMKAFETDIADLLEKQK